MKILAGIAVVACVLNAPVAPVAGAPDIILVGAPVHTMDEERPRAEAVALTDGRITGVGTREEVLGLGGEDTRIIELSPQWCVLPGLVDAHAHLHGLGKSLQTVSLVGTTSKAQCVERVQAGAAALPAGAWVEGRGWDQNDWEQSGFPTWRDLEGIPKHPVYLRRIDGHAVWVNRAALDVAGITRDTVDPAGGRIVRDADGEPTGVLVDNATELVSSHIPDPGPELIDARLRDAVRHCVRHGLVGMHDAGTTAAELASLERLAADGELGMRIYAMLSAEEPSLLDEWFERGPGTVAGGRVEVRSVKLYADGALGSRGAALLEPYRDDPGNRGLLVNDRARLAAVTKRALEAGFQVCTHAIGDRGNRVTLDVYEEALGDRAPELDHRFRIEHCQVVNEADFARFARLGVIASMQPTHATSDMPWARDRIGEERLRGAYAWRRFLDLGVTLPLGSDFPVEDVNPLWGIYAAVTRTDHDGQPEGGWYPSQRLTPGEAVYGFTVAAAIAAFAEDDRGRLREGQRADIVVVDRDVLAVEPRELLDAAVVYTIVDGEIVYDGTDQ